MLVDFLNDFMGRRCNQVSGANLSTGPLGAGILGDGVNAQLTTITAHVDVGRTIGLGQPSSSGWHGAAGAELRF
jgi:hypothetical protein